MHGPINVKSPNNITSWQMRFNSAFKGLNLLQHRVRRCSSKQGQVASFGGLLDNTQLDTHTHTRTYTHIHTHTRQDSDRVISPLQRQLPAQHKQTQRRNSMPSAKFEPAIPKIKRPQTHTFDGTATGIGPHSNLW
jgi:hypothetical protein